MKILSTAAINDWMTGQELLGLNLKHLLFSQNFSYNWSPKCLLLRFLYHNKKKDQIWGIYWWHKALYSCYYFFQICIFPHISICSSLEHIDRAQILRSRLTFSKLFDLND